MSHRGAGRWRMGDPIYMIECIATDGTSKFKLFPTRSGFEMGLRAAEADIVDPSYSHISSWAVKEVRKHIMDKTNFREFK